MYSSLQAFSEWLSSRALSRGLGCVQLETLPSSGLSRMADGEQNVSSGHLGLEGTHVLLIHHPLARISHMTHQVEGWLKMERGPLLLVGAARIGHRHLKGR